MYKKRNIRVYSVSTRIACWILAMHYQLIHKHMHFGQVSCIVLQQLNVTC